MKIKLFISTLVMFSIILFVFTACGTKEIDVSQYINVAFDGMDGEGTAVLEMNGLNDAIETAFLGDDNSLEKTVKILTELNAVQNSVSVDLDKDEALSNGDTVTAIITVDNDTAKENGISFVGAEKVEFTVSGLKEVKKMDPFAQEIFNVSEGEGIYIEYTGVSPCASIVIRNTLPDSNPLSKVEYVTEESLSKEIKKGQEITIIAKAPSDWSEDDYKLTQTSTTVICEKVDEYITSIDEIDDETWALIKAQCEDIKASNIDAYGYYPLFIDNDNYKHKMEQIGSISDYKYEKAYFFTVKDGIKMDSGRSMTKNGLYISYSVDFKDVPQGLFANTKADFENAYGCYKIHNIVKDKDGEIQFTAGMVEMDDYIYVDEETMKLKVINTNLDKFTMTEQPAEFK